MKVFFRRIHLYLSLAAGLVILVACLTGAILVFEKDLQMAINKKRYYVEAAGRQLPLETLVQRAKAAYPGIKVNSAKLYADAGRSVELNVSAAPPKSADGDQRKNGAAAARGGGGRAPGFTLFLNPYTGEVLARYSYRETFFYQVFALHRWLLGGNDSIGKYIVGISTLLFLFILITGIILWFPKTQKILKQRLKVRWDGGWKRLNHDLHIVLGFYSAIFLFIFAFTGLAWSFEWFNKGIYTVTNSPMKNPPPPKSAVLAGTQQVSLDAALATARQARPQAQFYALSGPKDSTDVFTVSALPASPAHENATDALYIDAYSGKLAGTLDYGQRSLGAQVRSAFKPVHTGSLWGTPTKIIAFIVCLLGVTFPITGTIMWINRIRKKKKVAGRAGRRQEVAV